MPTPLLAHQQRVVDEKDALLIKLRALRKFMLTPTFSAIDPAEAHRLAKQAVIMDLYADVLMERIKAFT